MLQEVFTANLPSEKLQSLLYTGQIESEGKLTGIRPIDVVRSHGANKVVFRYQERNPIQIGKLLWNILYLNKLVLLSGAFLTTILYGISLGHHFQPLNILCAALGVVLLNSAANLINDVQDYMHFVEESVRETEYLFSSMSPRVVMKIAVCLAILGFLLGLMVIRTAPFALFLIGAISLVLFSFYALPRLQLKYSFSGIALTSLLLGPLLSLGTSFAIFGNADSDVLFLGFSMGALVAGTISPSLFRKWGQAEVKPELSSADFHRAQYLPCVFYAFTGLFVVPLLPSKLSLAAIFLIAPLVVTHLQSLLKISGPHSPLLTQLQKRGYFIHLCIVILLCFLLGW